MSTGAWPVASVRNCPDVRSEFGDSCPLFYPNVLQLLARDALDYQAAVDERTHCLQKLEGHSGFKPIE